MRGSVFRWNCHSVFISGNVKLKSNECNHCQIHLCTRNNLASKRKWFRFLLLTSIHTMQHFSMKQGTESPMHIAPLCFMVLQVLTGDRVTKAHCSTLFHGVASVNRGQGHQSPLLHAASWCCASVNRGQGHQSPLLHAVSSCYKCCQQCWIEGNFQAAKF